MNAREGKMDEPAGFRAIASITMEIFRMASSFRLLSKFASYGEAQFGFVFGPGVVAKAEEVVHLMALVAGALSIYMMTFGGQFVFGGIVALGMLLVGTVYSHRLGYTKTDAPPPTPQETGNVGLYATVALGAFTVFTWILKIVYYVPASKSMAIVTWVNISWLPGNPFGSAFLFDVSVAWSPTFTAGLIFIGYIIPLAEELYFRGAIGNAATHYLGPIFGAIVGGVAFMVHHEPVYGYSAMILLSVFLDGATIITLDIATGRLLTGILAHVANNTLTFLVQGSVIGAVVGPFNFPTQAIVPALAFAFLAMKQVEKRRR